MSYVLLRIRHSFFAERFCLSAYSNNLLIQPDALKSISFTSTFNYYYYEVALINFSQTFTKHFHRDKNYLQTISEVLTVTLVPELVKLSILNIFGIPEFVCVILSDFEKPCYVMWNLFTVGGLQFCSDSTLASLEANQNLKNDLKRQGFLSQSTKFLPRHFTTA